MSSKNTEITSVPAGARVVFVDFGGHFEFARVLPRASKRQAVSVQFYDFQWGKVDWSRPIGCPEKLSRSGSAKDTMTRANCYAPLAVALGLAPKKPVPHTHAALEFFGLYNPQTSYTTDV